MALTARRGEIEIVAGAERLTKYQFNTMTAQHFFCSVCGIYTHHHRRSNPDEIGVNAACLEGVSPFDFACVLVADGRNHPSDTANGRSRIVGELHFVQRRSDEAAP